MTTKIDHLRLYKNELESLLLTISAVRGKEESAFLKTSRKATQLFVCLVTIEVNWLDQLG